VLKRLFDIVFSGVSIVLLAPVFGAIALLVKATSPGPLLFRQPRIGRGGRVYLMLKFRTMRAENAPTPAAAVPNVEDFGTYVFDPLYGGKQYTPVGKFLRSTSLDELPNLINVLRGDMSIVGPRPEVPELVEQYRPEFHRRHRVRPGITGLAQVSGRGDLTYEQTMQYDLQYVDQHSLAHDLAILLKTVPVVLSRRGAR
jgi:lipopolysaccharide/colanic/teichoic acid biosynthesis glycosyltransferase